MIVKVNYIPNSDVMEVAYEVALVTGVVYSYHEDKPAIDVSIARGTAIYTRTFLESCYHIKDYLFGSLYKHIVVAYGESASAESAADAVSVEAAAQIKDLLKKNFHIAPHDATLSFLSKRLPGADALVNYPEGSGMAGERGDLWNVVIHLNDKAHWSRERIADWLESLDVDLEFKNGSR